MDARATVHDGLAGNLGTTGYPMARVHLMQGRVEDTSPEQAPERMAILRLDADFYESRRLRRGNLLHVVADVTT